MMWSLAGYVVCLVWKFFGCLAWRVFFSKLLKGGRGRYVMFLESCLAVFQISRARKSW